MIKESRQLYRLACQVYRAQEHNRPRSGGEHEYRFDSVCRQAEELPRLRRHLHLATNRNWPHAVAQVRSNIRYALADLRNSLAQCEPAFTQQERQELTLRQLFDELAQLRREFDSLEFRSASSRLVVTTEPITLEGTHLGRFEIQLLLKQLGQTEAAEAIKIVAKEANPASSDDQVTHPHVSAERLCAGEAAAALGNALADGRLCDIFLLVNGVLTTYNAASAFVPLDEWEGSACHDCGCVESSDDLSYCGGCEKDFCSDCMNCCAGCNVRLCRGCLTACYECHALRCEECMQSCAGCNENHCLECVNDQKLCETCRTKENPVDDHATDSTDGSIATSESDREEDVAVSTGAGESVAAETV